ncbi:phosphoserine phosphatase SerB [Sphingomonas sp. NSE70-1]|uniref:Phosphoserine phosphatase n=1 Tax=Sphingomonas caseinilyticus TaxID=2908205 RepID=A0ABT0RRU0_9SPHN|nr:phosphoserine phosphatase SerB [Sphingomonas caseinilyticus]MCL6697395.1 phosphoserine phosphatase SerB [Sphingomonas caseinilyticus]
MRATGGFSTLVIATLIAAGRLDERLLTAALGRVQGSRLVCWIDQGDAADLEIPAELMAVRSAFQGWGEVDIIPHPAGPREKRLLVADMDSTMIGQECIDELADYAGVKPEVADITERAMQGELDFAGALKERVALLRGLDASVIDQCLAERIRPNAGAETLVRTMRSRGAMTMLVSGGFTAFVGPIAEKIGFERFEANVLGVTGGKLSGATEGRIVDSRRKHDVLSELRDQLGLVANQTLAIGDGANDIPMIEEAGLGIAYRAKPALAAVADARLDHHGLDALLWAQGIPKSEWVGE